MIPGKVTLPRGKITTSGACVRSHLSRLKITEEAREAVLAHARPGIKGIYDLHHYRAEKFEALELSGARLRSITDPPPPSNVTPLVRARP